MKKTAIVTGGAGLLGHHFCEALARAKMNVVVADINARGADHVAKQIGKKYALGVHCDVSSPASVKRLVSAAVRRFGQIDILVNNAACQPADKQKFFADFENYSLDTWRDVTAVNLDGMFLVAQAVGRRMIAQGSGGSIIQTSSIYGLLAPDHRIYEGSFHKGGSLSSPAVYAASKAAILGLTRYLAAYWAKQGIRVNTLVPGGVESGQNEIFVRKYSARVPMGRMARPEEMVGAVLYLASDASSYVTGQALVVDGGLTAW